MCDGLDARLTSLLDGITPCEGKNASDASTEPSASSPAFSSAILTELTLFGCPEPMPRSLPWVATVMALDLTCLTTLHANLAPRTARGWGACWDDLEVDILGDEAIGGLLQPAAANLAEGGRRVLGLASRMRRFLDLPLSTSRPFSVYEGR